jgi:RNA polymerase sigma-70 factor (ECF subfamily)
MTVESPYVRRMVPPAERTDAQVVRDVLAGDRDAYRLLVRRYGDVLHAHALRMVGCQDTAAELVQQALVKGYRKLSSCREPDRVGAWLFRILANLSRDHVRSPRRRDVPLAVLPDIPSGGGTPDEAAAGAEIRARVHDALSHLTPEQREAFVLKHVEGRSYEEIAAVMDLSVAALKMRVHRAREALRGLLEEFA